MHIHKVRLKNFRSHRDTAVNLFPITVFVGHGGSGKSNFFDGLLNISMVSRKRVGEAFSAFPSATFAATKFWDAHPLDPISFSLDVSPERASDSPYHYELSYSQVAGAFVGEPNFQIRKEILGRDGITIFDRDNLGDFKGEASSYITHDRSLLAALRQASFNKLPHGCPDDLVQLARDISHVGKYRLEPFLLSRPSNLPMGGETETTESGFWLDYRGENLASVLYELSERSPDQLEAIAECVRIPFPDFDSFAFNFVGEGRVGFSVRFTHHKEPVVAAALSHGMLLFIGLMTLLHMPTRPDVVALEEPENGLDAAAVRAFYRKLVEVCAADPANAKKQILLSSHSPYVLCEAWNGVSRGFVFHVTEQGGQSTVASVEAVMHTFGGALASDGSMSIRLAERIMSERWQPGPH
jgi:putative AbiEii toxin of type IV toxin-antitoxin system/AAA ATPase-like protein